MRILRNLYRTRPIGTLVALLLAVAVAVSGGLTLAPSASADGDPGSDVLVYQPLFLAADSGISIKQQSQLGTMLSNANRAGFALRVAIIAKPDDLGAITQLWRKPRAYARFLGLELSLAYKGRLLVVMPDGYGFNWPGHTTGSSYGTLTHLHPSGSGQNLATATEHAISDLAAANGIEITSSASTRGNPSASSRPGSATTVETPGSKAGSTRIFAFVALVLVIAAIVAARVLYSRHRRAVQNATIRVSTQVTRRRAVLVASVAVVTVVLGGAIYTRSGSRTPSANAALAFNPVLDPGTSLNRPAPNFELTDQLGRRISLRSFRGKVVILAFNDSECTSMCPLTTTAMLDAKAMLGPAGRNVQLLGVDANPKATSLEDVLSYSEVHGMVHAWDFLTGSLSQLKRVWKAYSIGVEINRNLVDHTPGIFVIDPQGRLRKLFITQQSYAAVGQLGQLLASQASKLLPGHPQVHSHLSYSHVSGISPTSQTTLRAAGGGKLRLGPGKPRMVLFFATWDRQITGLAGGLEGLTRYESLAARQGLPELTSIDEGSVEPPGALHSFMQALPSRLNYPVGIDASGRLADGYEVEGQPWLMVVNSAGKIAMYYSVAALGWPSAAKLARLAREALQRVPATSPATELAGSPSRLAALHRQAAQVIGNYSGLDQRIRALHGYPIVLNVWASWCIPCRSEFNLFAAASARFGHHVAFLGANADDSTSDARAFLRQHPVSYPSYSVKTSQLTPLASIAGLPTTIYISATGKVVYVHTGQYSSQGILDSDISTYSRPGS